MMPTEEEEEGSGSDPQITDMEPNQNTSPPPSKSFFSMVRINVDYREVESSCLCVPWQETDEKNMYV